MLLWPALAALAAAGASAQDAGTSVHFSPASVSAAPAVPASAGLVYDSGESEPTREAWDTVLFQGRSSAPGAVFEVSRRLPSGAWSPWTAAEVKRHANGRFWGRARLGPGAGALRVRARVAGGGPLPSVEVWSVEVFESSDAEVGPAAADQEPAPAAVETPGPRAFTRRDWKALAPKEPYLASVPRRATLHHTSGSRPATLAESLQEVGFIQDFHQNGRGWNDIGYHYLIDAAGRLFEGRPESVLGAHVRGHNAGNIGVAFLGTHHAPKNHPVPKAQLDAFVDLLVYLSRRYAMKPESLLGHRDYSDTDCPGDLAAPWLKEARRRLANPPAALAGLPSALGSAAPAALSWDGVLP